jgi:hypothetical protein
MIRDVGDVPGFFYVHDNSNHVGFIRWRYENILTELGGIELLNTNLGALGFPTNTLAKSEEELVFFSRKNYEEFKSLNGSAKIYVANENPLWYYGKLSKSVHYLTDESFLDFYPSASSLPNICVRKSFGSSKERDIDVLFIASKRGGNFVGHHDVFEYAKNLINNFNSLFLTSEVKQKAILGVLHGNEEYVPLVQNLNGAGQLVRFLRRLIIEQSLADLSKEGLKIVSFGDFPESDSRIERHKYLDHSQIEEYFCRSKLVVSTTPNHTSLLSERFVASLAYGSIPVFEPFPQYCIFPGWEDYSFTYETNVFKNTIVKILRDYDFFNKKFAEESDIFFDKFSPYNFLRFIYADQSRVSSV